jgi:hypothetical protein
VYFFSTLGDHPVQPLSTISTDRFFFSFPSHVPLLPPSLILDDIDIPLLQPLSKLQ